MQKIRKGDTVQVISGNDIGLQGEVRDIIKGWRVNRQRIRTRDHNKDRVVVDGVNFVKKHQGATQQARQTGIIDLEAPIHLSNVMLVCPSCGEPVRVGVRVDEDKKHRYCKRCDSNID